MSNAPTIADWFGAVGGVAAALALAFGVFTYWRQGEARKREQADRISAWLVQPPQGRGSSVRVLNSSDRAIYDCKVRVIEHGDPATLIGRDAPREFAATELAVVPPGEPIHLFETQGIGRVTAAASRAGVELVFRDQADQHWRRTADGHLESLTKHAAAAAHKDPGPGSKAAGSG